MAHRAVLGDKLRAARQLDDLPARDVEALVDHDLLVSADPARSPDKARADDVAATTPPVTITGVAGLPNPRREIQ